MPYRSTSVVVIHYEEALHQVYGPLPYLYLWFSAITGVVVIHATIFAVSHLCEYII